MGFSFPCKCCDQVHEGIPTFGDDAPAIHYWIDEGERERRITLDTDTCVVDDARYLIRGCIEIAVHGEPDPFIWGAWVDVSQRDFEICTWWRISEMTAFGPSSKSRNQSIRCIGSNAKAFPHPASSRFMSM